MNVSTAKSILGIPWTVKVDKKGIEKAWKQTMRAVHPDKSFDSQSKEKTQRANEAKDVLMSYYFPETAAEIMDKLRRQQDEEMEQILLRKQQQEARVQEEYQKKLEQHRKAMEELNKQREQMRKDYEEMMRKLQETKDTPHEGNATAGSGDRYPKKRQKRCEGTRVHRKTEDSKEACALIEEIKKFVRERFVAAERVHVPARRIMEEFTKNRENTTEHELHMFQLHLRRLLLAAWPQAKCSVHKGQRCYAQIQLI